MKRLFAFTFSLVIFSSFAAFAQSVKISGTVTDENGDPLMGTAVFVQGGNAGTVTDLNGRYSIAVDKSAKVLSFSFLSYVTQDILISDRQTIDVQLLPDENNSINEVYVIGYGTTKKSDLTGSVTNVKMSDIKDAPNISIDQALQGRLAGVDIMNTSGAPGASTSIRIRGTRSITASNEPLIIVDGVIDAISDISEINSADVESISVMKDASSTAIYGSRGSNGVILITTKKGTTSKPRINFKAEAGFSQLARSLDLMNAEEFLRYRNDYNFFLKGATSEPKYDPSDYSNNTDWQKEITRIAPYQNYSVSVGGRVGDKLNYFGSLGYNNTQGIVDKSGFQRLNARFNMSYDMFKWFNLALKLGYTYRDVDQNKAYIGGTHFWEGAIYLAPTLGPNDTVNPLYENGTPINTPRASLDQIEKNSIQDTQSDVIELTFKPVKGLKILSQNAYVKYHRSDFQFWPSTLPKRVEGQGSDAYRYEATSRKISSENTISYSTKIKGNHSIDALVGFSVSKSNRDYFSLKAVGLLVDDLKWNNMAGVTSKENLTPSTSNESVTKESVFARFNYNYKGKYYLTATGRYDGSSNFAANNKWGFFPSAAVKWVIKKENFLKNTGWVNDLAVRFSVGQTGNDAIAAYQSLQAYTTQIKSYLFGGSQSASVLPSRIANPNLTWEKTTAYNLAIDASFFHDRLGITLEGYVSKTSDLLLTVPVIRSTGYENHLSNLGKTTNKGVELTVDGKIFEKSKFGWDVQFTLSHNTQMVDEIGQEDYVSVLKSPGNNSFMMYGYKKGYPLNSLWGFQYAGVWHDVESFERNKFTHTYVSNTTTSNGKSVLGYAKYVDQDHNGILSQDDLIYLGNSDPVLYGGLQNNFHIGNLSLGFYFTYSLGGKIYNYAELSLAGTYSANQYRYMESGWHPLRNPDSDIPRAGQESRMLPSNFCVHDASYLRLKNASISYKFDLSKTKVLRDITLTASGSNLFLVSKYNGFDPDVSTSDDDTGATSTLRRVDMGAYPQSRMIIFSIQISY